MTDTFFCLLVCFDLFLFVCLFVCFTVMEPTVKRTSPLQKLSMAFGNLFHKPSRRRSLTSEVKKQIDEQLLYLNKQDKYGTDETLTAISSVRNIPRNIIGISIEGFVPDGQIESYTSAVSSVAEYLHGAHFIQVFVNIVTCLQSSLQTSEEKSLALRCISEALYIFIDCCDSYMPLVEEFVTFENVEWLLQFIICLKSPGMVYSETEQPLVDTIYCRSLCVLHSCVRQSRESRSIYRKAKAVDTLFTLDKEENKKDECSHIVLVLILAYIVNEKESEALGKSEDCVKALTILLNEAVSREGHYARTSKTAFSATVLMDGLSRLLINDANKMEFARNDGLSAITKMLQPDFSEEEHNVATEALWNLSFLERIRKTKEVQESVQSKFWCLDKMLFDSENYI